MTKRWIILISIVLGLLCLGAEKVNRAQDIENQAFLKALDENLINSIRMLSAFDAGADRMDSFKGVPEYRQFLMNNTMECSQMRSIITAAEGAEATERNARIRELIETINPGISFEYKPVNDEQDQENRVYLARFGTLMMQEIKHLTGMIVERERTFAASGTLDQEYFNLHSHHYLYSMVLNLISPSKHLSKTNRAVLAHLVHGVEAQLQAEAAQQHKANE